MRRPSADRGRGHHRAGVAAPAGEVDDAEHLVRDRVPDRHPGTGELLEVLDVVLVAEHPRRAAAFERGADAVRADVLLGVAEAGGQPHLVQARLQPRVAGVAGEHDAVGVAEDDADGFVRELLRGLAPAPGGRRAAGRTHRRGRTRTARRGGPPARATAGTGSTTRGSAPGRPPRPRRPRPGTPCGPAPAGRIRRPPGSAGRPGVMRGAGPASLRPSRPPRSCSGPWSSAICDPRLRPR